MLAEPTYLSPARSVFGRVLAVVSECYLDSDDSEPRPCVLSAADLTVIHDE